MNCEGLLLFTKMPTFSSCHDPLVRPPPTPRSTLPSLFKVEVEQTGLFSREGHTAVDYALPPLVFIHHLPHVPLPPFSHYLPHPSMLLEHSLPQSFPGVISLLS